MAIAYPGREEEFTTTLTSKLPQDEAEFFTFEVREMIRIGIGDVKYGKGSDMHVNAAAQNMVILGGAIAQDTPELLETWAMTILELCNDLTNPFVFGFGVIVAMTDARSNLQDFFWSFVQ